MKEVIGLRVLIASDILYEHLIAEIYKDDKYVGLLTQDSGIEHVRIIFPGEENNKDDIQRDLEVEWLIYAIKYAKEKLISKSTVPVSI